MISQTRKQVDVVDALLRMIRMFPVNFMLLAIPSNAFQGDCYVPSTPSRQY